MTAQAWYSLALFLIVLVALAYPIALYMSRLADAAPLRGFAGKVEHLVYRAAGVDSSLDMPWTTYAVALLAFNALGVLPSMRCSGCRCGCRSIPSTVQCHRRFGLQYRDQLRDQHQLAGLRRRIHHELSHADGWPWRCRISSPRRPALPWRSP